MERGIRKGKADLIRGSPGFKATCVAQFAFLDFELVFPARGRVLEPEVPFVQLLPVDEEVNRRRGVFDLHIEHHLLPLNSENHSSDRPGQRT